MSTCHNANLIKWVCMVIEIVDALIVAQEYWGSQLSRISSGTIQVPLLEVKLVCVFIQVKKSNTHFPWWGKPLWQGRHALASWIWIHDGSWMGLRWMVLGRTRNQDLGPLLLVFFLHQILIHHKAWKDEVGHHYSPQWGRDENKTHYQSPQSTLA